MKLKRHTFADRWLFATLGSVFLAVTVFLFWWLGAAGVRADEVPDPKPSATKKINKDPGADLPSAGREDTKKHKKGDPSQIRERGMRKRLSETPSPGDPVPIPYPNIGQKAVE